MVAVYSISDALKQRALLHIGEAFFTPNGEDMPSQAVETLYLPTLREFYSAHRWHWYLTASDLTPNNPLCVYDVGSDIKPWVFIPNGITDIPDAYGAAQQAFTLLLASRVAPVLGRIDLLSTLVQQYRIALSTARHRSAWETCQEGLGLNSGSITSIATATNDNVAELIASEIQRLGSYADLNHIDMSGVTSFYIYDATTGWRGLFQGLIFYGDISKWDVSNVTDFSYAFYGATVGELDLSSWTTNQVVSMYRMCENATFQADISGWDVSGVATFERAFFNATIGELDLSSWDVSGATTLSTMFSYSDFTGDIGGWDVSNVTNFMYMFAECPYFNSDLSAWQPSSGVNFAGMFKRSILYNQPMANWDVSNALYMNNMFEGATSFNQDLSGWDLSQDADRTNMFLDSAYAYTQP